MSVKCATCGEQLLGAVNRCWRCGTQVASHAGDADLPPVRRAPIRPEDDAQAGGGSGPEMPVASIVPAETDEASGAKRAGDRADPSAARSADALPVAARRVGSPFAQDDSPSAAGGNAGSASPRSYFPITEARYPRMSAAAGGAVAALVLGAMSLIFSFFTWLAVITALLGLVMGIWGLYSTRRGPAMVGVLLCCLALAIGGFNGLVSFYKSQHGYAPWDAPSESELYDDYEYEEPVDF